MAAPDAPAGLGDTGRALWDAVQRDYELEEHETALLLTLCRTADRLDELSAIIVREGVLQPGVDRVHPALVEHRQQAIAYARLAAALRLPSGDENDPAADRRPQRRGGARGVYGIRGAVS